ncbi:probable histone-arginine methyltransferase 1.3 isoform X2 [Telopea speciosissima]|uniref:probable histone-arginine methyltransferase 1.3 isoform X2 n=1 Tax=Telopea speciosissima TaxID=54955 RepID=UPI001CC6D70E|nr:probable histone-arginine methyltransferase 1.3 isoform X2 [Telopea speciosissima]
MEAYLGQKDKQQEFTVSISQLSASSPAASCSSALARFSIKPQGAQLRFHQESEPSDDILVDLRTAQLFKLGPVESVCVEEGSTSSEDQKSYSRGITIRFKVEDESRAFHQAFEHWNTEAVQVCSGEGLENGQILACKSKFDDKIEASSAKMYFHYYGQLLHQQNMLQDYVRTGTYYAAVVENRTDFIGRVVVDVGAGSGILSLFAAQVGAKHVYAVEASEMAEYARRLIAGNPSLGQRITVIKGKVEEVELPEKADILISEPMGYTWHHSAMNIYMLKLQIRPCFGNNKIIMGLTLLPYTDLHFKDTFLRSLLPLNHGNGYFGVSTSHIYGSLFSKLSTISEGGGGVHDEHFCYHLFLLLVQSNQRITEVNLV